MFDIPVFSRPWWAGTVVTIMFRWAAKRLILEDVWGAACGPNATAQLCGRGQAGLALSFYLLMFGLDSWLRTLHVAS